MVFSSAGQKQRLYEEANANHVDFLSTAVA